MCRKFDQNVFLSKMKVHCYECAQFFFRFQFIFVRSSNEHVLANDYLGSDQFCIDQDDGTGYANWCGEVSESLEDVVVDYWVWFYFVISSRSLCWVCYTLYHNRCNNIRDTFNAKKLLPFPTWCSWTTSTYLLEIRFCCHWILCGINVISLWYQ